MKISGRPDEHVTVYSFSREEVLQIIQEKLAMVGEIRQPFAYQCHVERSALVSNSDTGDDEIFLAGGPSITYVVRNK